ncbi:MAG: phosphoglucosamine mutase [Clostridia bacterium]|nr:phosphoglucosamine mutase [Clostridia bacterium]
MGIYFGTDGIRGVAGIDLTSEMAFKIGQTICKLKNCPKILIAKDTRMSGDYLLTAFASGAVGGGAYVTSIELAPTPCVSFLVKKHKFDFGVVISASHNPAEFNGIKIFGSDGKKITDDQEFEIEKLLFHNCMMNEYGKFSTRLSLIEEYISHLQSSLGEISLAGIEIVIDCANGAASLIAPHIFESLGAKVHVLSTETNGNNINNGCGALFTQDLRSKVVEIGADVGFAFDGDADRIIAVDNLGNEFDGDQIIYFLSKKFKRDGELFANKIVATIQTNLQIEHELEKLDIRMIRSDVGDKYVIELMEKSGAVLGGEQSGHIIVKKYMESGDGILVALLILKYLAIDGTKLSDERLDCLTPQYVRNIVVQNKDKVICSGDLLKAKMAAEEKLLDGRIILRKSGTEPKIRIMIESNNESLSEEILEKLALVVEHIDKFE